MAIKKEINQTDLAKYDKKDSNKNWFQKEIWSIHLHDFHNDYPLGPEQVEVTENMLSEYCQKIQNKYGI